MVKFNLSRHKCQAAVICCMDFRLHIDSTIHDYLTERGVQGFDVISVPGAGKALLGEHADLVLNALEISYNLHHASEIYIIHHADCGAYGGRHAFETKEAEIEKHKNEMDLAKEVITKRFGSMFPVIRKVLFDEENEKLVATQF